MADFALALRLHVLYLSFSCEKETGPVCFLNKNAVNNDLGKLAPGVSMQRSRNNG
jgi:hypothetical protein